MQHGFRSSRSCETQHISIIQDRTSTHNNNQQTHYSIMDFAKAADKVIAIIRHIEQTLSWMSSLLSNKTRSELLNCENCLSEYVKFRSHKHADDNIISYKKINTHIWIIISQI